MSQTTFPQSVDVLVVGGGPTGLLTTYILLRSGLKVLTIEQYNKAEQSLYGRACVLQAGSLELLDLLGIYDRISDIGFIVKGALTYRDGEPTTNRGWGFVDRAIAKGSSQFDFSFTIRQKYIEATIRSAISEISHNIIREQVKLVGYHETGLSEYPITATVEFGGMLTEIHCKYLVGADGGRSTVRSLGKFPFPGVSSPYKWVRLDAIVKTDMPFSRSKLVAVESQVYGNVLWLPIDNSRTRIGFVCPDDVYGENGKDIDDKAIMAAAQNAVKPFTLEFVTLDWWTVYAIGQRVAERYKDGHVILAGDAAHTHSSGSAQGVNTGIHDAINLGWKLAGVLDDLYHESVLDTYDLERRASANYLIQLDKDVSSLISGKIPSHFNAPPGSDFNEYLELVNAKNAAFTVGLGISYDTNLLNQGVPNDGSPSIAIKSGHRALDVPLYRPGVAYPRSLRSLIPYVGRFWILVFAGALERTPDAVRLNSDCAMSYRALREYVDSPCSFTHTLNPAFEFLTILHGEGGLQSAETLGAQPLGKTLYDRSGEAYAKYGIGPAGANVVLRPDGIVCFSSALNGGEALSRYFSTFVSRRPDNKIINGKFIKHDSDALAAGEISIEGREELTRMPNSLSKL